MLGIPGKRLYILILVGILIGISLSTASLSWGVATPTTRVYHARFTFSHDARTPLGGIEPQIGRFLSSTFGATADQDVQNTVLSQVVAAIDEQAHSGGWTTLHLDMWARGQTSPTGYYLEYAGRDKIGSVIRGAAFVANPHMVLPTASPDQFLRPQFDVQEWTSECNSDCTR